MLISGEGAEYATFKHYRELSMGSSASSSDLNLNDLKKSQVQDHSDFKWQEICTLCRYVPPTF